METEDDSLLEALNSNAYFDLENKFNKHINKVNKKVTKRMGDRPSPKEADARSDYFNTLAQHQTKRAEKSGKALTRLANYLDKNPDKFPQYQQSSKLPDDENNYEKFHGKQSSGLLDYNDNTGKYEKPKVFDYTKDEDGKEHYRFNKYKGLNSYIKKVNKDIGNAREIEKEKTKNNKPYMQQQQNFYQKPNELQNMMHKDSEKINKVYNNPEPAKNNDNKQQTFNAPAILDQFTNDQQSNNIVSKYATRPKSVIVRKIAALRSLYHKWMIRAKTSKDTGFVAKIKRMCAKVLGVIDKLLKIVNNKLKGKAQKVN